MTWLMEHPGVRCQHEHEHPPLPAGTRPASSAPPLTHMTLLLEQPLPRVDPRYAI